MSNVASGCRDCAMLTSGRCWRHSVLQTVVKGAPLMGLDTWYEIQSERDRLRAECDSRRAQNIADAELIRETDARIAAARDHLDILINNLPPVANCDARVIARRALSALDANHSESPNSSQACVFGVYCSRHDFIHGAEADELREKLARTRNTVVLRVLESVDARDSLAWREHRKAEEAAAQPEAGKGTPT